MTAYMAQPETIEHAIAVAQHDTHDGYEERMECLVELRERPGPITHLKWATYYQNKHASTGYALK